LDRSGGGVDALGGAARAGAVRERNGAGAFVLRVDLTFERDEDARELVRAWGEVADYARAHEPFLEHYEIMRSDADPLKYSIYERYRSKEDYLGPHKASAKFLEFRPKMRALEEQGKLFVSGASFVELGVGFVR
jgi:quinol monooxygenase YgiN